MTIKSKKAIAYIEQNTADVDIIYPLTNDQVAEVISLAETEAHDRAVEAFKKACSCGVQAGIGPKCERFVNCGRYKCFINELNK